MSTNQHLSRMMRWKSLESNIRNKKIATHILSTNAILFSIVVIQYDLLKYLSLKFTLLMCIGANSSLIA